MDEFAQLKEELLHCRRCKDRFVHEPKPIFQGNQDAKIVQISQAPSKTVMETGKPFNDVSGRKLREEWYQISDTVFYDPANFYITSITRCFPGKAKHGSGDLPPIKACADYYLQKELKLLHPECMVVIGSYAARYLFGNGCSLEELIFHDQMLNDCMTYVLPHPSPLNRRWLRDHPLFETERMPKIRTKIHTILTK